MHTILSTPLILAISIGALSLAISSASADTDKGGAGFLNRLQLPKTCSQAIFVTADNWDTKLGAMRLYERVSGLWKPVEGAEWHVGIGQKGLGWGRGLIPLNGKAGPEKVEGDLKSPAGVFELGDAFGYDPQPPHGCRLPYRQCTDRDYFVDDAQSPDYNKWVRIEGEPNDPDGRWESFERMLLPYDAYRLGIVVRQNMSPTVSGKGSAVFIHLWGDSSSSTAGCTSMSETSILTLMRWLDPKKHPLLVQLPWSAIIELNSKQGVIR